MEVTVEDLGKLKRKLTVEVPLQDVSAAYDEVYGRIRSNIRIDGFRPGKFPRHLAEKRFKELMSQEALQNLVPKYLEQVLQEKKMQPATEPQFDNLDIDKSRPLKFNVEFEIIPDFELVDAKEFVVAKQEVLLEPDAVEQRIEEMRAQHATPEPKEGPADAGDRVTFDFVGTLDGEAFEGGSAQGQQAELGAGQYLEAFEQQLTGMKTGEEKTFPFTFPEDYGQGDLAGKTAEFAVTVQKVEGKKPAELNAEFFKQFGQAETEADFRKQIEDRLRTEREQEVERDYQEKLAEQIKARYDFDVPESLIERAVADFERHQLEEHPEMREDPAKLEEAKAEEGKRQATDLRLSYILQRYAREYGITLSPEEIRTRFMLQAYMMRQNPEELIRSRFGDMLLHQIQEQLLTTKTLGQMVDRILGRETPPEPQAEAIGAPGGPAEGEALAHTHGAAHEHSHEHGHDHEHGHVHDHDPAHEHEHEHD